MPPLSHLTAFFENVDQALAPITPLTSAEGEDLHRVQGDNLKPHPSLPLIIGAYVGSASVDRARLVAASLRPSPPEICTLSATNEPGVPPAWEDWRMRPLPVEASEDHQLEIANSAAGAAEDVYGLLWFARQVPSPVTGAWRTIRATGTTTLTAGDWSSVSLTLTDDLKKGVYEIGGCVCITATGVAWRVDQGRSPEPSNLKPGGLAVDAQTDAMHPAFYPWRHGIYGSLGTFEHDEPLDLQVLATAGDTAQEVFLDVRKVS